MKISILGAALFLVASGARAQSARVEGLLKQMTLEEKLSFLSGSRDPRSLGEAGYLPGVPRLGIPELRLTDGPAGVRVAHPATALPAPVALAASFSPGLARRFGTVLGREARALEQDVLLSPMTNIVRVPQGGRNFETLGEDPLLASRLVAAEVAGVQGEGIIATVKHFAVNNFEQGRMSVDVRIDERTLREIYLPAFEAAVRAGAGSVMGAYNKVNGVYACENPVLLTSFLREEWGFSGFVMSDWFATHSSLPALSAGLDVEMPGSGMGNFGPPSFFSPKGLQGAPTAQIDRAVGRILTAMEKIHLLDGPRPRPSIESVAPDDAKAAREVAISGSVLLKNARAILPLSPDDLRSLAVIGVPARTPMIGGGGSSAVAPLRKDSPLEALARRTGKPVEFTEGVDLDGEPIPASALKLDGTEAIDFVGTRALKTPKNAWSGTLTAATDGVYAVKLQARGGTARLTLDGKPLLNTGMFFGGSDSLLPTRDGLKNGTAFVTLKAGEARRIAIEATAGGPFPGMPETGPMEVRLAWVTPQRRAKKIAEAVALAKTAKVAVVFAYDEGTEGSDRDSLALPGDQDALIEAITTANPRTIVVLNTGCCVTMPWEKKAAAILETWFPGQEGADATAAILCGEVDPGGRLPITFPKRLEDAPSAAPDRYPGVNGTASYAEGIFVGYRHYDAKKVAPLFPFGHGLSYARFSLGAASAMRLPDGGARVRFTVKNLSRRAGVAVPQVYAEAPKNAPVPMAARSLVGFESVSLAPGEEKVVTAELSKRALGFWDESKHDWTIPPGERAILVGFSSRDLPRRAVLK